MWIACLLAFISSACTLVIEIIAGRIMAPYIGVSLYTWTSVIGVVLAGMSVGNFVGGVVADRFASRRTLGLIFMAGGVSCLGILCVTHAIVGTTFGLSFLPRIVVYVAASFFLPSFVLGMVSPVVVRPGLAHVERAGRAGGRRARDVFPGGGPACAGQPRPQRPYRRPHLRLFDDRIDRRHLPHRILS